MTGDEISVENVQQALHILYTTTDESYRNKSHEWLLHVQNSENVWAILEPLLASSQGLAPQLFAATCLRHKLLKAWDECPVDQREGLRSFLVTSVFGSRFPAVRERLCSALALYSLRTMPDIWTDPVNDLIGSATTDNLASVLQILSLLPVEFRNLAMPVEMRPVVRSSLASRRHIIQDFLEKCFKCSTSEEVTKLSIHCLEAWYEFESDLSDWTDLIALCLTTPCIDEQGSLREVIGREICDFVATLVSNSAIYQYPSLILSLVHWIASFTESASVPKSPYQVAQEEAADEVVLATVRMVSALVEHQAGFLLRHLSNAEHRASMLKILLCLARMTLYPGIYPVDEIFSIMTYQAWLNIYEDFIGLDSKADPVTRGTAEQELTPIIQSVGGELVKRKLRIPPDLSSEDAELFESYRHDLSDVLAVFHRILGDHFCELFWDFFHFDSEPQSSDQAWRDRETAFFALESIGDNNVGDGLLENVILRLSSLTVPCAELACSILRMIYKYSTLIIDMKWFEHVLPVIVKYLSEQGTVTYATLALKDLAENRDPDFLLACNRAFPNGAYECVLSALYNCVMEPSNHNTDRMRALTSLGHIMSLLPYDSILNLLNNLLSARISVLQRYAELQEIDKEGKETVLQELEFLATLCGSLDPKVHQPETVRSDHTHPVYLIVSSCFGCFQKLVQQAKFDPAVVMGICQVLKRSLAILMLGSESLLTQYVDFVILAFSGPPNTPDPCLIDLTRLLVVVFAGEKQVEALLVKLFNGLSERVLNLSCSRENGDVIESYLGFCQQCLKKQKICKQFFFAAPQLSLNEMAEIGRRGLEFPEPSVLKQSAGLWCELLKHSDVTSVKAFVQLHGSTLVQCCFNRIKQESLISSVEHLADVLFVLVSSHGECLGEWLQLLPQNPLVLSMMKENANKRKLREFAKKINVACRKGQLAL